MIQTKIYKFQATPFDELKIQLQKWGTHYKFLNEILARTIAVGIFQGEFSGKLLSAYAKLHKLDEARKIFDQMPDRDVGSWTSLQNIYLNIKQPRKALLIFSEFIFSDFVKLDSHCIVSALSSCARCKDLRNGRAIHCMAIKFLEKPMPNVYNALIDMYGKTRKVDLAQRVFEGIDYKDVAIWTSLLNGFIVIGDMGSAQAVFDEMPQRNVVSWTAMIVGHVRHKNPVKALELFLRMRREDFGEQCNPTTFTVVALLSACADIGALNLGTSVHGYIHKRYRFVLDDTVNNGLMDMYGKSGNLDLAAKVFYSMRRKDLFSWNTMISGLALNGRGKDALLVFDSMVKSGIIPNEVTFLSVLSACSHAGLVHEGEKLFERFVYGYHMKPRIEHYGCMVDLFLRAGCLEKAGWLVEQMPMKPDAVIWRSLLVACVRQGNFELAEVARNNVLELDPGSDGAYVLLFSICRSRNRWGDASGAMKMMRDQRIKKTPGCSWIEVNGVVHEFLAEASRHYVCDDIVFVLNGVVEHSRLDTDVFLELS